MPTKKEDKKELRHIEWAEQIAECQSSGMKIKDWCKMKGIQVMIQSTVLLFLFTMKQKMHNLTSGV
ncbi:MAG: hypothetical protein PUA84_09095 [Oscillospiraceae bacterium]|nr:hypothetical protein [Oscillospiraceae bacterium]